MAVTRSRKADWGQVLLAIAPFVLVFGPATANNDSSRVSMAVWGIIFAVWGIAWGAYPATQATDGSIAKPNYSRAFAVLLCWTVVALLILPVFTTGRSPRWEFQAGVAAVAGVCLLALGLVRWRKGESARHFAVPVLMGVIAIGYSALTGFTGWSTARRETAAAEDFQLFISKISEGDNLPEIAPLRNDPIETEVAIHVAKNCYLTTARLGQEFRKASVQDAIDELVEKRDAGATDESLQELVSRERATLEALGAAVQKSNAACMEKVRSVSISPELREAISQGLLRTYRASKAFIDERSAYLDEIG